MNKILSFIFLLISFFSFAGKAQQVRLNAVYDDYTKIIKVDWNMINHNGKTTYVLLRSTDRKNWVQTVTDRKMQLYTGEDIFDYDDKSFQREAKNYYCLKIIDVNMNAIAYSNVVIVNTVSSKSGWLIYSNPVNDVLTLSYKGSEVIKGVINVIVYDLNGKAIIKFRSASIYRTIRIPVTSLQKGYYVVQVRILNELMMNQKFLKQ